MKVDFELQKQQDRAIDPNSQIDERNTKRTGTSRRRVGIFLLLLCVLTLIFYYFIAAMVNKRILEISSISSIKTSALHLVDTKASQGAGELNNMAIKESQVTNAAVQDKSAMNSKKLIGGDKDEHGCYLSAGYSWCHKTNQCERPWILAQKEGFENSAAGFKKYCQNE